MKDSGGEAGRTADVLPSPHNNIRGAWWVLLSALAFSFSMALVKFMGAGYPPPMQVFIRQLVGLLVLVPFILRDPVAAFATRQLGMFAARSIATSLAMILAFGSYQRLPLAEANALSFTRTLWMVPLAIVILGEKVGLFRFFATLAGFGGVLLILRPGDSGGITLLPALYGLAAAMLLAFSVTGIKALSRSHGQLQLLCWAGVFGVLFTLPAAIMVWRLPSLHDGLLLTVMGATGAVSQFCYIRGLSMGDATVLAPFDYSRIILTSALGFFFFQEVPTSTTWIGVVIIVGAAVLITWHSRRYAMRIRAAAVDREI
jgi:drug/metabolite transporter (DMT)-like permease